ncbi:hypothetical protein ACTVZO_42925 [Streptomyces sp. IBSNAI002]|uniref:hypothetical protein n=1 Tax=Streptomyces sp. IBSNAI002 TaxID=3457500 RepID=UPI003FD2A39A
MRYTRRTLAITTALLALTGITTTAHADNNGDNKDGKSNICYIHVEGNHNHNACGSIKYGNNATTGQGHAVTGLGVTDDPDGPLPRMHSPSSRTRRLASLQPIVRQPRRICAIRRTSIPPSSLSGLSSREYS